jgi:hypothetical protein
MPPGFTRPRGLRRNLPQDRALWNDQKRTVFEEGQGVTAGSEPVAMLLAAGRYTTGEIARALGRSEASVKRLQAEPGFAALVGDYARRFGCSGAEARLLEDEDAEQTVDTLRRLRDGNFEDDPAAASVRLRAAQTLFQRQIPPAKTTHEKGPGVVINLSAETVERMKALVEAKDEPVIPIEGKTIQ